MEKAFGVIPLKKTGIGWKVLIILHKNRLAHSQYWGFPKGHPNPKETPFETAVRELKEETHLHIVKSFEPTFLDEYDYVFEGKTLHKQVTYFLAIVSGKIILQETEISDCKWLSLEEARKELTYPGAKKILARIAKILKSE